MRRKCLLIVLRYRTYYRHRRCQEQGGRPACCLKQQLTKQASKSPRSPPLFLNIYSTHTTSSLEHCPALRSVFQAPSQDLLPLSTKSASEWSFAVTSGKIQARRKEWWQNRTGSCSGRRKRTALVLDHNSL